MDHCPTKLHPLTVTIAPRARPTASCYCPFPTSASAMPAFPYWKSRSSSSRLASTKSGEPMDRGKRRSSRRSPDCCRCRAPARSPSTASTVSATASPTAVSAASPRRSPSTPNSSPAPNSMLSMSKPRAPKALCPGPAERARSRRLHPPENRRLLQRDAQKTIAGPGLDRPPAAGAPGRTPRHPRRRRRYGGGRTAADITGVGDRDIAPAVGPETVAYFA